MSIKTEICGFCGQAITGKDYIYRWYRQDKTYKPTHSIHIKLNFKDTKGFLNA